MRDCHRQSIEYGWKEVKKITMQISKTILRKINKKGAGTLDMATKVFGSLLVLGVMGFVFIIIFGNLQGSSGFDPGTQGYNDTRDVTQNLTAGASSFFSNAGTWLTLLSVVIIIAIVALVIARVKGGGRGGGDL